MLAPREKLWSAPKEVVSKALRLLGLTAEDHLVDYGCGDGIALFVASQEYGAKATGYEIHEPRATALARRVLEEHLEDRITIVCGNALEADPSIPTAVYLYLIESCGSLPFSTAFLGSFLPRHCASLPQTSPTSSTRSFCTLSSQRSRGAKKSKLLWPLLPLLEVSPQIPVVEGATVAAQQRMRGELCCFYYPYWMLSS